MHNKYCIVSSFKKQYQLPTELFTIQNKIKDPWTKYSRRFTLARTNNFLSAMMLKEFFREDKGKCIFVSSCFI